MKVHGFTKQWAGRGRHFGANLHGRMEHAMTTVDAVAPYFRNIYNECDMARADLEGAFVSCGYWDDGCPDISQPTETVRIPLTNQAYANDPIFTVRGFYAGSTHHPLWVGERCIELTAPTGNDLGDRAFAYFWPDHRCMITRALDGDYSQNAFRLFWPLVVTLLGLDRLPLPHEEPEVITEHPVPVITLGTDPEYEVYRDRSLVCADRILGCDTHSPIGTDGAGDQLELRPDPGTPEEVVANLRYLIKEFTITYPGYSLSVRGRLLPLGGHVHVGVPDTHRHFGRSLMDLLDMFVGRPTIDMSGRARSGYRRLGQWEEKPWGFEYRTPPAGIFATPRLALTTLRIVEGVVASWYRYSELDVAVDHDGVAIVDEYPRLAGVPLAEAAWWRTTIAHLARAPMPSVLLAWGAWRRGAHPIPGRITFTGVWDLAVRATMTRLLSGITQDVTLFGLSDSRGQYVTTIDVPGLDVVNVEGVGMRQYGLSRYLRTYTNGYLRYFANAIIDDLRGGS